MGYNDMKRLNGTPEQLQAIDTRINQGMSETIEGYHADRYTEIQQDEQGSFILIDENDLRNPLQFLTNEEIGLLTDYIPIQEEPEL